MTPIFYNKLFKKLNNTISINYKNIIKGKKIDFKGLSRTFFVIQNLYDTLFLRVVNDYSSLFYK